MKIDTKYEIILGLILRLAQTGRTGFWAKEVGEMVSFLKEKKPQTFQEVILALKEGYDYLDQEVCEEQGYGGLFPCLDIMSEKVVFRFHDRGDYEICQTGVSGGGQDPLLNSLEYLYHHGDDADADIAIFFLVYEEGFTLSSIFSNLATACQVRELKNSEVTWFFSEKDCGTKILILDEGGGEYSLERLYGNLSPCNPILSEKIIQEELFSWSGVVALEKVGLTPQDVISNLEV